MVRLTGKVTVLLGALLLASQSARAQGNGNGNGQGNSGQGNPNQPVIDAAAISGDRTILFVRGSNLGPNPLVTLDGLTLGGVQVDAIGQQLIAQMPTVTSGTYRLRVKVEPSSLTSR